MKLRKLGGVLRRALFLLLAMTLLLLCGELTPRARAVEKTLTLTPGRYVRWRKGLPPQDEQWHRILMINTTWGDRFMQGNTTIDSLDGKNTDIWLHEKESLNQGVLAKVLPGFDLSNDVNYTLYYYNTPAVRFAQYDSKNNHDAAAPMYYFRLADWTGDEGNLTDVGLVPGDEAGHVMIGAWKSGAAYPWAFLTSEHDDDVDDGRVVVERFRKGGLTGSSYYLTFSTVTGDCNITAERTQWVMADENILYYGDEIAIDTIADGQVIEDGEIVNINSGSYLTLAAGSTLTVKDGGILSIGSGMYNDGTIRVEKGGTLIVKQDAFIMPWATGQKTGSIICDGGDVIVYSGGRVVCEGPGGFKFAGEDGRYGTVFNYGAIITTSLTATGKARSFHNEGSIMLGYTVNNRNSQAFRDGVLTVSGGRASITGLKTGKINVDQVSEEVITGNGVIRP